jgi:hypothetical protein
MREKRNTYIVVGGKTKRKRALGRPRHRWEYDIKMDLKEVGQKGV